MSMYTHVLLASCVLTCVHVCRCSCMCVLASHTCVTPWLVLIPGLPCSTGEAECAIRRRGCAPGTGFSSIRPADYLSDTASDACTRLPGPGSPSRANVHHQEEPALASWDSCTPGPELCTVGHLPGGGVPAHPASCPRAGLRHAQSS